MVKQFPARLLASLAKRYGTPLWVYDAALIRQRISQLRMFDTIRFAQKACSNIHLLRLVQAEGVVVDAVSNGEIVRALKAGFSAAHPDSGIIFTADVLDKETLATVVQRGIPVNAGSIDVIDVLGACAPGHSVWLRINPGFGHGHSKKTNTGGENSKHGIWYADLHAALERVRRYRLDLVGVHMHIGSGVDYDHLARVCDTMADLVIDMDHDVRAISAGGGLPIPYQTHQTYIDTSHYFGLWDAARRRIEAHVGHAVRIEVEPGRYLVAEAGLLLAEVLAVKGMGCNRFALVDAGFNDLVRPAMYGAYHGITLVASTGELVDRPMQDIVVAGPLCESGDVFTQIDGGIVTRRQLPSPRVSDLVVFHDVGAYGASMSSNYNSRPLSAEVLLDGSAARLIRRRQTIDELLSLEDVDD